MTEFVISWKQLVRQSKWEPFHANTTQEQLATCRNQFTVEPTASGVHEKQNAMIINTCAESNSHGGRNCLPKYTISKKNEAIILLLITYLNIYQF